MYNGGMWLMWSHGRAAEHPYNKICSLSNR